MLGVPTGSRRIGQRQPGSPDRPDRHLGSGRRSDRGFVATGSPSTLTAVTFNGTLSFDNETALDRYVWARGNEFAPTPLVPDSSVVICRYRLGSFTATLQVTDQGTGVIDPGTGTFEYQRTSAPDTVTVNIVSP